MKRHTIARLGGLLVAGLIVLGSVGGVTAASTTSTPTQDPATCAKPNLSGADHGIGELRRFGDCEIDRRLTVLGRLATRVSDSPTLTDADRAALSSQISSTQSGLTALRNTIDHETDVTALKADIRNIATDYRVYVLVVPKTVEVIAADRLQAGYTRFENVEQRLANAIAAAKAAGKDVTQAQADYDAMASKVDEAESLLTPVVGSIINMTPADWNTGTAGPALKSARGTLLQVRGLFTGAHPDARACVADLRALGA